MAFVVKVLGNGLAISFLLQDLKLHTCAGSGGCRCRCRLQLQSHVVSQINTIHVRHPRARMAFEGSA